MIIQPDWSVFKAKFSANPHDTFEWFSYLLFCRKYDLKEGWFGYKNQSGIEKQPLVLGNKVIGFQSKFYDVPLSSKKDELIKTLNTSKEHYPNLTHLIIYTNQLWGQGNAKDGKSTALIAIEERASELNIEIIWNEHSFFESEFVCIENNDLARHFFTNDDYQGWDRFKDWSSTQANVDSLYFTDNDIKVVLPNQKREDASHVINGINAIRNELKQPKTSVRLVGLSGVGKTRLAQALFDDRIGKNPLDVREVWYCDYGESPSPLPLHFIEDLKQKNKKFIVIVDNCGRDQHEILTKSITNDNSQISLLTIEYDISDDLPEKTSVFKLEPNSPTLVQKVIERHYPKINSPIPHDIAQLTGGNYRLALAIASTVNKVDNIAILNDKQLFERLFYQNGQINEENYKIAQVFSLVFSFNIKDLSEPNSELQILSDIAEVSPRTAKQVIEQLKAKDVVQQRGDFRAILPHVLANHLSKQALQWIDDDELHDIFVKMPSRLQRSMIKRLSYLHDNEVVCNFVQKILTKEGFIGKKLLDGSISEEEINYLRLLSHIEPRAILELIEERHTRDNLFLTSENPHISKIEYLIKLLSYKYENFSQSFNLLLAIAKNKPKDSSTQSTLTSMFSLYTSESLATLDLKKPLLQHLFDNKDFEILLNILKSAIDFNSGGVLYSNLDNGEKRDGYGYHPKTNGEIWNWTEFLLNLLNQLDILGYKEAKEIFTSQLKPLIRSCYQGGFMDRYVLDFHSRKPFIKASIALNELISYDYEELQSNHPQTLKNLQNLIITLQPKLGELEQLIQHYILIGGFELARYQREAEKRLSLKVPNFDSYDEFIQYISKELMNSNDLRSCLALLLSSDNPHLKYTGIVIYPKIVENSNLNDVLQGLTDLSISRRPYLLLGLLKELKNNSLNDYKSTILELVKSDEFKQVVPWLTFELSQTDDDFDFLCELLDLKLDIDFYDYAWISVKKERGEISSEQFEKVFDSLIQNSYEIAIDQTFQLESTYMKSLSDKYISPFLKRVPSIYSSHKTFDIEGMLKLLLSNNKSIERAFDVFIELFNSEKYLSLNQENQTFVALKALLKTDTKQFIKRFVENGYLIFNFISWGHSDLLFYAEESAVTDWISEDEQVRIDFWIRYANLLRIEDQIGIRKFHWSHLIVYLIDKSNNPESVIDAVLAHNVYEIHSYTGSYSNGMRDQLDVFDSLKEHLIKNSLEKYILYLEIKHTEWLEAIKAQELKEAEKRKKDEGFDY
ncbi:hypothetical protein IEE84_12865 [Psychrobacter sp. 28M-43]|uniref:hypothetical protein n=1 Tax=Psychrobacter sp. 28M-43 TaxID=2772254 RepID=UPI00168CEC95|nr:hypothetical protein [Psychrobacter sp. 28M-43]QOD12717.1 hypothetical protein IEE84_12865 [Psychrobacter sp. 28M-43]